MQSRVRDYTSRYLTLSSEQKFVAKKARKFIQQGNHLVLPGLELSYVFNCIGLAPRYILLDVHLDRVSTVLADLHKVGDPTAYGNSDDEYWDGEILVICF